MNLKHLYIIAILEGIVSLGIEVTAIRQISPFYGSSLEITTIILSIFLAALAAGYKQGGENNKKIESGSRLQNNFLIVLFTAPIFLSYVPMSLLFQIDKSYMMFFVWTFFAIAVPIFFLGQTLPILSSLSKFKTHSKASSFVMYYSTIGSVVGTVGVSAFLFNTIGVSKTIIVLSILIVIMIFVVNKGKSKNRSDIFSSQLILTTTVFFMIVSINSNLNFLSENAYANVEVLKTKNGYTIMRVNNNASSLLSKDELPSKYIQNFQKFIEIRTKANEKKTILVLGAGGYSFDFNYNKHFVTYVEINPDLKSVAEKNFLKTQVKGKNIVSDARKYLLQNTDKKYDYIIIDAYNSRIEVPTHLLTLDFFKSVKEHLNDKGMVLINLIARPMFTDKFSKVVRNTIDLGLGNCTYTAEINNNNFTDNFTNIFTQCDPFEKRKEVFTDDLNRASLYESGLTL